MAEWLRRLPAKQFPFGSVGSNPAVVVFCLDGVEYEESGINLHNFLYGRSRKNKKMEVRGIDPRAPRMQSECSTI